MKIVNHMEREQDCDHCSYNVQFFSKFLLVFLSFREKKDSWSIQRNRQQSKAKQNEAKWRGDCVPSSI